MAGFDPSVISTIPDGAGNPVQAEQQAFTLKRDADQNQIAQLEVAGAKRARSDDNTLRQLFQDMPHSTPAEFNALTEKAVSMGVSPKTVMPLQRERQQIESGNADTELKRIEIAQQQAQPMIASFDSVLGQIQPFKTMVDQGKMTQAELDGITAARALPEIQRLAKDHPELAPHLSQFLQNPKSLTYQGLTTQEAQFAQGRAMMDERQKTLRAALDERREATSERRAATYEANEQSLERHRLDSEAGERSKPESGYEWVDPRDHSKGETPVKGGSKDSEKPMTGREAQMFGRIVTSANLGVQALKNVVELPVGASTGLFGVGGGPGKSLLESAKGALTNKLASQDVQDYNVMIAGLSRNLSTMETQGLAPGVNFTESFNAVQLRDGDTQMTKLRKLAESRQILEKGLEPALDNPRVPEAQKAEVRKLIADVQKAVPFEQHDLTVLRRTQATHPNMTLQDVIRGKGLDKSKSDKSSPQAAPSSGWGEAQVVTK